MVHLDLVPLTQADVPEPGTPEFTRFLDEHFAAGEKLINAIPQWSKGPVKNGDIQIMKMDSANQRQLGLEEYWASRTSTHSELYDTFKAGLFDNHSEHEKEYIEACKTAKCLQVFEKGVAEVWRMGYDTPPPTNPRTFVILLLGRETGRSFVNISLPFDHPDCKPKQGEEKSRVRARYVSVEQVREVGEKVEWVMATSSDAGGNIPRFITNSSLPGQIAADVPSFLKWVKMH